MAPKASTKASTAKKDAPPHASYQNMIKDAIAQLKERNGSSRPAIKKYIKANYSFTADDNQFDSRINRAIRAGVEKGEFAQPKGPSGGTKLAKKEVKKEVKPAAKKPAAKKPAAKKETKAKEPAAKKAAPKKAATKKEATEKKPAAKPKKATTKKETTEKKPAISKTKTGRVTKPAAEKKAAAKPKAAAKKVTKKPAEKKTEAA